MWPKCSGDCQYQTDWPESHLTQMGATHERTLKITVPTDRCGPGVFLTPVLHSGQHRSCPTPLGQLRNMLVDLRNMKKSFLHQWLLSMSEVQLKRFWHILQQNLRSKGVTPGPGYRHQFQVLWPSTLSGLFQLPKQTCGTSWHTGCTKIHLYTDDNCRQPKNK